MPQVSEVHRVLPGQLNTPPRLLMGPGPSNAHPRVLQALGNRQVGHLDPAFIALMTEVQEMLRYMFQTENKVVIPVSGTGSAAMECTAANLIEPGDEVLVAINGFFGIRYADMAGRYGGNVNIINKPWGQVFTLEEIAAAFDKYHPKIFMCVHAETSTGACQPLGGIGDLCRKHDVLWVVDTVTGLGGVPLFVDDAGIDAVYSGSQKCLGCPPGIAPVTFNDRAMAKVMGRKTKVANWYLDVSLVGKYWGKERTYHHTAPINMNYGFREACRLIVEEGLESCWKRHMDNGEMLWAEVEAIGCKFLVDKAIRLPQLATILIPDDVDGAAVVGYLRSKYNIEIAGGLGELAGKVWRVGLMGYNSRPENVKLFVAALAEALQKCKKAAPSTA